MRAVSFGHNGETALFAAVVVADVVVDIKVGTRHAGFLLAAAAAAAAAQCRLRRGDGRHCRDHGRRVRVRVRGRVNGAAAAGEVFVDPREQVGETRARKDAVVHDWIREISVLRARVRAPGRMKLVKESMKCPIHTHISETRVN